MLDTQAQFPFPALTLEHSQRCLNQPNCSEVTHLRFFSSNKLHQTQDSAPLLIRGSLLKHTHVYARARAFRARTQTVQPNRLPHAHFKTTRMLASTERASGQETNRQNSIKQSLRKTHFLQQLQKELKTVCMHVFTWTPWDPLPAGLETHRRLQHTLFVGAAALIFSIQFWFYSSKSQRQSPQGALQSQ